MPKNAKAQEKLENIIISLRDGLSEFASLIEDINKSSSMLLKLFSKTEKELKSIKLDRGTHAVTSTATPAAPIVGIKSGQDAREKAANLLFNMLSGGTSGAESPATSTVSAHPSSPPLRSGPPSSSSGPPGRPPSAPPSAPAKSPSGLPPPPKLPPKAPGIPTPGVSTQPSFMKAPPGMSPPPSKPGAPMTAGSPPAAPVAAGGGGGAGLSSLRDEMLKELDRLKKIMKGG
ncbi:MAG: hypothetical protein JW776_13970 [Candidatus Lokiarchaeota archaeon]|nr:hypothetical protein [Candidatus Lokiarchaeota archaeon]